MEDVKQAQDNKKYKGSIDQRNQEKAPLYLYAVVWI